MTMTRQSGMYGVMEQAKGTFYNGTGVIIPKGTLCRFSALHTLIVCTDGAGSNGQTAVCVTDAAIAVADWGMVTMAGGCEVLAGTALATAGVQCKTDGTGRVIAVSANKDIVVGYTIGVAGAANDMIAFYLTPCGPMSA